MPEKELTPLQKLRISQSIGQMAQGLLSPPQAATPMRTPSNLQLGQVNPEMMQMLMRRRMR